MLREAGEEVLQRLMLDSIRPWNMAASEKAARPALSLILCSRNDEYMGNSRWRLETTLNYTAKQIEALGRSGDVELVVTDWGSEIPLREVLRLSPAAAALVSIVLVPPAIARLLQKDSPFPEVLALNAAARRANGQFIGRIDQDTLVGRRFLEVFFDLYERRRRIDVPLESALLFSNIRMVPYRFAVRTPSFADVERFIERFGDRFKIEITAHKPFHRHSIGILLLPRAVWHECGGYDETMLYMNAMEYDLIDRLLQRYRIVNLGELIGYDFFHLEHYHPWVPRKSSVYRKENLYSRKATAPYHPNGANWGLYDHSLPVTPYLPDRTAVASRHGDHSENEIRFALLMIPVAAQVACDLVILGFDNARKRWRGRALKIWYMLQTEPIHRWTPKLLELWRNRGKPT